MYPGKSSIVETKRQTLDFGPSGLAILHQEHTMSGFRSEMQMGINGIELDVFLIKDNKVVVFHDDGMLGKIGSWFKLFPEIQSDLAKAPGNQNDQTFLNFMLEVDPVGKATGSTLIGAEYNLIDSDTIEKFHSKQ